MNKDNLTAYEVVTEEELTDILFSDVPLRPIFKHKKTS